MALYLYKATDGQGQIHKGSMTAANLEDLEARLQKLNLALLSAKQGGGPSSLAARFGPQITRQDLILFCFHMEQLTRAGVPLLEGLGDLRDSITNIRFRDVLTAIIQDVEGGRTLSQAMAEFPWLFPMIFTNLVHVGEQTGNLSHIFLDLTENLKWEDEMVSQTKKAVMYPAFVGMVIVGVVFFLMIYLVPQLVSFIKNMGGTLPMHTRALIATSDFFVNYWYVVLAVPITTVFTIRIGCKTSIGFQRHWDRLKLNIWLFGPLTRKMILARFAATMALMYRSGVTVLESLRICEGIAGNLVIREAIQQVGKSVGEGQGLNASLQISGLFPPLVLRMVKVGESTGQLDSALQNVSYFFTREVREFIEKLQTMIEPVMTVTMGLILGWVMISVLGPIYDLMSKIKI